MREVRASAARTGAAAQELQREATGEASLPRAEPVVFALQAFGPVLPPLLLVLGKGGVGRSTVSVGLALELAARGERVLVVQWAVSDALSPWFGHAPAGYDARTIAPGVDTMNFTAEAALEHYFVGHLGMRTFYRAVIARGGVRRATRAAPGFEELMFLGTLMWQTALAREERGWAYDHVIVDAPAMGHGEALLHVPRATAALPLGGLLATEVARVQAMLEDPRRTAGIVVTTLEELAVEETVELWPEVTHALGRAPIAAVINRSVAALDPARAAESAWVRQAPRGIERVLAQIKRRSEREAELAAWLARAAPPAPLRIDDALLLDDDPSPLQVLHRASRGLEDLR